MSKIACIYFEGNDSKIALITKDKDKLKILKADSIDMSLAFSEKSTAPVKGNGSTKTKEMYNYDYTVEETSGFNRAYLTKLNEFFFGEDISKIQFIPILCEPAIYFQKINDDKELASLNLNKKGKLDQTIGFVDLYDKSRLAVYPSGKSNYLQAIDSLARLNSRKYLKIPAVKTAELSLANYIAKKYKFKGDENTLILYVGKEYSKLIFLKGDKLAYIGANLSVGKNSFNAHNVIVSKILLEMEQGGLNNIENIIVCGEDDSDELVNIIRESYPRSKVKRLLIDDIEALNIDKFTTILGLSVPIAVAQEFFIDIEKKHAGVNLLPEYVKAEQKKFVLGWQGYLILLMILASVVSFGTLIYFNTIEGVNKDREINRLMLIEAKNKDVAQRIKSYQNKIQNVDKTKVVLNNLSSGTGILSAQMLKLSNFTNARRNTWMSKLLLDQNKNLKLEGFTFSRFVAKELSDTYTGALLQNIIYEPLRETRVFKFSVNAGNIMRGAL